MANNNEKENFVDISSTKQVNKLYGKGKGNLKRVFVMIISVILLITGCGFTFYYSAIDSVKYQDIDNQDYTLPSRSLNPFIKPTTNKNGNNQDPTNDNSDYQWSDNSNFALKDDELLEDSKILNIMLFGEDNARGAQFGRSDSMIMLSIDNRHKKVKLTSFQRDSYVYIPGYGQDKLTNAYAYGGPSLTISTIQSNFGIKVDRYAVVDYSSFIDIIDTLGGIDLEVTQDEIDYINYQLYKNHQSKTRTTITNAPGKVHLTGQQALWYARNRGLDKSEEEIGIAGDDWDRTSRQRKLLETVFNDFKHSDLTQIIKIVSAVGPKITTNLKKTEITALVSRSLTYLSYNTEQFNVPSEGLWYYDNNTPAGSVIIISDVGQQRRSFAEFVFEDLVIG